MELPSFLPGWKTIRQIGKGGFSTVYEIKKDDDVGDFRAALKVISIPSDEADYASLQEDGYDDQSITMIYKSRIDDMTKEFSLMSRLKVSNNIVGYEDHMVVPKEDGFGWNIYIRMELLTPINEYIRTHGLSEEFALDVGINICKALERCEAINVIHRDIKPQNIFINEFGDIKLGDFGIAKTSDHTTRATKTGTYSYMAPEVYSNRPYSHTVDIYSLGLLLYWLLNERRLPFLVLPPEVPKASDMDQAQYRRISGEALPMPKNGSDELKAAVLKACAFNPQQRYQSAREMRGALELAKKHIDISFDDEATVGLFNLPPNVANAFRTPVNAGTLVNQEQIPAGQSMNSVATGLVPDERTVLCNEEEATAYLYERGEQTVHAVPAVGEPVQTDPNTNSNQPQTGFNVAGTVFNSNMNNGNGNQVHGSKRKKCVPLLITCISLLSVALIGFFLLIGYNKKAAKESLKETARISSLKQTARTNTKKTGEVSTDTPTMNSAEKTSTETTNEETDSTGFTSPEPEWSDWCDTLPNAISKDKYDIEERSQYRLGQLKSSTSSKMEGCELIGETPSDSWGIWTDWSTEAIPEAQNRQIETRTMFSYRNKQEQTSTSKELAGWTLDGQKVSYGDYGAWSDWSGKTATGSDTREVQSMVQYRYRSISPKTVYDNWSAWSDWSDTAVSANELTEVETRTVYAYYYYSCPNCGAHMHGWNFTCLEWAGGCGACTITSDRSVIVWSTTPFDSAGFSDWGVSGYYVATVDGIRVFKWQDGINNGWATKTQYRNRTRGSHVENEYGAWSKWENKEYKANSKQEVQKKTIYRYRDKAPIYHFYQWGGWSAWSTNRQGTSDKCEERTQTEYRYRDKTTQVTYNFIKWGEWADVDSSSPKESDERKMECRKIYRYREK